MYDKNMKIRPDTIDGETNWFWDANDDGAWDGPKQDWETSHRQKYLQHVTARDVVVTAGGNQGLYTRLYSNIFNKVYSFEPDAKNFHFLVMNNQKENVVKMNCGLGNTADFLSMHRPQPNNTGMHEIANIPGIVPILPLDSFNFKTLNLLQLDVEGYEFNVLLGAIRTIERCRPVIVLERGNKPEIINLLSTLKYSHVGHSVSDDIFIIKS